MKLIYQKTGEYHLEKGIENQDAVKYSESETAEIIVIADGVSDCENSRQGAELACEAVSGIMLKETDYLFSSQKEKTAGLIVSYVYKVLSELAKEQGQTVESYSSTLSFICRNKLSGEVMSFVLGDSLIYSLSEGKMSLACKGDIFDEYKTCTTTTKGAMYAADINIFRVCCDTDFILATDGAWINFYVNGVFSDDLEQVGADGLISYLEKHKCADDCSVIIMHIPKGE